MARYNSKCDFLRASKEIIKTISIEIRIKYNPFLEEIYNHLQNNETEYW